MKHKLRIPNILLGPLLIATIALTVSYKPGQMRELLQNLATPCSGEREVLPPEALFVLDYVRKHNVKSVTLSKHISENRFLAQPVTESIYPAIVNDRGEIYLSYINDLLPNGCTLLSASKGVGIAACH